MPMTSQIKAMEIINDYLCERKQRTKIGDNFSSWRDIIYGVLQGIYIGSSPLQYLYK